MILNSIFSDLIECEMFIPYGDAYIIYELNNNSFINEKEEREDGIYLKIECHQIDYQKYNKYVVKKQGKIMGNYKFDVYKGDENKKNDS